MTSKHYNSIDFYKAYIASIEQGTVYDIDFKTYRSIIFDYFKFIRDAIFDGNEFKLPCRLGTIQIVKHKPKQYDKQSLRYDWKAMKELGKPVYYFNEHSGGYKFRYLWGKKDMLVTNKAKYMFIASRANKRQLAQIIKNNLHDYMPI